MTDFWHSRMMSREMFGMIIAIEISEKAIWTTIYETPHLLYETIYYKS